MSLKKACARFVFDNGKKTLATTTLAYNLAVIAVIITVTPAHPFVYPAMLYVVLVGNIFAAALYSVLGLGEIVKLVAGVTGEGGNG